MGAAPPRAWPARRAAAPRARAGRARRRHAPRKATPCSRARRPGRSAGRRAYAMRDAVVLQQRREVEVLPEETIVAARVEPEEGVRTAQFRSGRGDRVERGVV